jgi:hypothetical protein
MEAIMFRLLCQCSEADTIEMLRELRELKSMSQQEREIYALLDPDAAVFATCGTDSICSYIHHVNDERHECFVFTRLGKQAHWSQRCSI